MSRFDSESLNAAHTQRHLDEIRQRAPTAEKMAAAALARAGLVQRLRVTGNPQNHDPRSLLADYAVSRLEAANALEQLERELAAEKALADMFYRGCVDPECTLVGAVEAYRKARGL